MKSVPNEAFREAFEQESLVALPDSEIQVILVDDNDRELGFADKLEVHKKGVLHRAISVFLFNDKGETLIQRRSFSKYHCPGLWSNSCCSHPLPGESVEGAASRRLFEELSLVSELEKVMTVKYKTLLPAGLVEHEYDHVFIGEVDGETVNFNPQEVVETRFANPNLLLKELTQSPNVYTPWFKILLPKLALKLGL